MKAVLVVCEGQHDIVFSQRSLGAHAGCSWVNSPMDKLPSPFGAQPLALPKGLIVKRYTKRALGDARLQDARHSPLPSFESAMCHDPTETVFFMVRAHGQDRSGAVLELLSELDAVLDSGVKLAVDEYAVAFLYDADDAGISATLEQFRERFAGHFGDLAGLTPRSWQVASRVPVGCFIFHATGKETGTLEDELGPMVERAWPDKVGAAKQFIDKHGSDGDEAIAKRAAWWKAVITAAGQFNRPGRPMSRVIDRNALPAHVFTASDISKQLAEFLLAVPWHRAAP